MGSITAPDRLWTRTAPEAAQRRIVRALLALTARDDVPLLTQFEPEGTPLPAA
jgi:hypothetical protein